MSHVKKGQERVVFGPNVPQQQIPNYGTPTTPSTSRK